MKNLLKSMAAVVIASLAGTTNAAAQTITTESSIWVTIEESTAIPFLRGGKLTSDHQKMNELIDGFHITKVEQALPDSRKESLQKVYEITCRCNGDKLAEVMNRDAVFSQAEEAPTYELLGNPPVNTNDYDAVFTDDYAMDLIGAKGAWGYSTGDSSIILGISDGSFLENHEELQTEYVSVVNSSTIPINYFYHGTAVAITAAGATNNSTGKSAIGFDCRLALNTLGYNQMLQLSYGGARVINASWTSGCFYSSYYQEIIDEINENGSIIVAAAGNGGTCGGASNLVYPASLNGVISVTSIGPSDNHERHIGDSTSTHQHNAAVDLCAPGYDVALTIAPGVYMTGNGSSFATPYVTGTIGLMLSLRPCLDYHDVLEILKETAVNIDANNLNYQGRLGAGRLDAAAALEMVAGMSCDPLHDPMINSPELNTGVGVLTSNTGSSGSSGSTGTDVGTTVKSPEANINTGGNQRSVFTDDLSNPMVTFEARLFPNPTNETATVQWNQNTVREVQIIDATGSLIEVKQLHEGTRQTTIEVPRNGLYFIRLIQNNDSIWTQKLIKL